MESKLYVDYLDVDDSYFPVVNESTIEEAEKKDPLFWMQTYPHESFVKMLEAIANSLQRVDGETKSLWIEGAYGSGKSHCAYALRRILETSAENLREFWRRYDVELAHGKPELLERLLAGKSKKRIVTAYRYGSADVETDQKFYFALQETVMKALRDAGIPYEQGALRNAAISWFEKETAGRKLNKEYFDGLLAGGGSRFFSQKLTADEIVKRLKHSKDADELNSLMDAIAQVAQENQINALVLTVDDLKDWLRNVVEKNGIQFVFIWDEFSEFFTTHKTLTSLQKLNELCGVVPFYFVLVTHGVANSSADNQEDWKKLVDRFTRIAIELPENVALQLIAHAFPPKENRRKEWLELAEELNDGLKESREAVMDSARIRDPRIVERIIPIQPIAALALKHLASAFQSNQRSMFNFIKTKDPNVPAFQWFIRNHGPFGKENAPLLTVDYLWDFFYVRNAASLTPRVRAVFDRFAELNNNLDDKELRVLKTTLIMQALSAETGEGKELLLPTLENLTLSFEGIHDLERKTCGNVVNNLVKKNVLIERQFGKLKVFNVETIGTGDSGFRKYEKKVREHADTGQLVSAGGLDAVLDLTTPLAMRFGVNGKPKVYTATEKDFAVVLQNLGKAPFDAVVLFARDAEEAKRLRKLVRDSDLVPKLQHTAFIDATETTVDHELFERYVVNQAWAEYYQSSLGDRQAARKFTEHAKSTLAEWKKAIQNGSFTLSYQGREQRINTAQGVREALKKIVLDRYPQALEFDAPFTEGQLSTSQLAWSARCGFEKKTEQVVKGLEKLLFHEQKWPEPEYWRSRPDDKISRFKRALDAFIERKFVETGKASVLEIWNYLESEFGFAKCNLYSLLAGFLLREYALDPAYRYMEESNSSEGRRATPELLAEALGAVLSTSGRNKDLRNALLVRQTPQEKAACGFASNVFDARVNVADDVGRAYVEFFARRGFPVEFILDSLEPEQRSYMETLAAIAEERDDAKRRDLVETLGVDVRRAPENLDGMLVRSLSEDAFARAADAFLKKWNDGALLRAADKIGASMTFDVKKRFGANPSLVVSRSRWEPLLEALKTEYDFVDASNALLECAAPSKELAIQQWQKLLKKTFVSWDAFPGKGAKLGSFLRQLYNRTASNASEFVVDPDVVEELRRNRADVLRSLKPDLRFFESLYQDELDPSLTEEDLRQIVRMLPKEMFDKDGEQCRRIVREAVAQLLKDQFRERLKNLWFEKTGTKNPEEWSQNARVPIQCMLEPGEEKEGVKALKAVDDADSTSNRELEKALDFFNRTSFFERLADPDERDARFEEQFLKDRPTVMLDEAKAALLEVEPDVQSWYVNRGKTNQVLNRLVDRKYDSVRDSIVRQWQANTGTTTPKEWSDRYQTPIQIMLDPDEADDALVVFNTLNDVRKAEHSALDSANDWLRLDKARALFTRLDDERERNKRFAERFLQDQRRLLSHELAAAELKKFWRQAWDWLQNPVKANEILNELTYRTFQNKKQEVLKKIDNMDDKKLRSYLKKLIDDNPKLGVEILLDGRDE